MKAHAVTLTGESNFFQCYKLNFIFDTCRGIYKSFTVTDGASRNRMNHNFVQKEVKMKNLKVVTFCIEK